MIMFFAIHIHQSTTCNTSTFTFCFIIRGAHPVRFTISFSRDCEIVIVNNNFWIFCSNIKVDYIWNQISVHQYIIMLSTNYICTIFNWSRFKQKARMTNYFILHIRVYRKIFLFLHFINILKENTN